jgi:hypothetical protein
LFGTPESCKKIIKNLKEIDVDEIACLIDFGVDSDLVMAHLHYLNQVRREANIQAPVSSGENNYDSIADKGTESNPYAVHAINGSDAGDG